MHTYQAFKLCIASCVTCGTACFWIIHIIGTNVITTELLATDRDDLSWSYEDPGPVSLGWPPDPNQNGLLLPYSWMLPWLVHNLHYT